MDKKDFKQLDITENTSGDGNLYRQYERNYPKYFMQDNNVDFYVLTEAEKYRLTADGAKFSINTKLNHNRHFWTHETMMNCLYEDKNAESTESFVRIEFFGKSVFRVRINEGGTLNGGVDLSALPTRMLTGEPDKNIKIESCERENEVVLKTAEIEVRVSLKPFLIKAYDRKGRLIFSQKGYETWISDSFRTSFAKNSDNCAFYESLLLRQDEKIFGLGERFDHIERVGKNVDFWNKDAIGTTSGRSYINIPFYWSNKGYGLFLNNYGKTQWEVGTKDSGALTFGTEGEYLDYFVMCADTPAGILKQYAGLTGHADMPPVWSFGLWMSRNSYMSWDVVDEVVADMNEKEIPFDVIHLDTAWFKDDWNCDLKFSEERFANPKEKIAQLKEDGIYISLWQYNFIPNKENENLKTAVEKGYLVKGESGEPYTYPEYVKGSWIDDAIIDFTNPEAAKWYADMIEDLAKMGAGAIKTDFGEGIPERGIYKSIDGKYIHNYYSLIYNHIIYSRLRQNDKNTLVWARSGTAGSQRYPIHWGGDCQCTWSGLAGTLKGMLSAGLSGIAFFSHDIGGFIGRPSPELYVRWAQLGLLSSHSRCHGAGNNNSREPSAFGEEAVSIFKKFAALRYSLLPYIVGQSLKSTEQGLPLARHLALEFPHDPVSYEIEDEYMLGGKLLVAPVLEPLEHAATRKVYLPQCMGWYDYTAKQPVGCGYHEVKSSLENVSIYVRNDAVIPYGRVRGRTKNTLERVVKIEVYPLFEGDWEYSLDGIDIKMRVEDGKLILLNHNMEMDPEIVFVK